MSLTDQVRSDLKDAMRAKDEMRTGTIRLLLSALKYEQDAKRQRALDAVTTARGLDLREIPEGELPTEEPLTEAEIRQVIGREVKKRQDSVETYRKASREELAAAEESEIAILQCYLPAQMDREEARSRVAAIIGEVQAGGAPLGAGDMKRIMPVVVERLRDQVDGRTLNQLVRELITS